MKKLLVLLIALPLIGAVARTPGHAQKTNDVSDFMQMKLEHAQKVLGALVVEDYDSLARHSQRLSLLSQAATWRVLQTPEYLRHSGDFRRSADALTQAAKDKNMDGAALAYVNLTMKCISCHKYVRGVRMARLPEIAPPQVVALEQSTLGSLAAAQ